MATEKRKNNNFTNNFIFSACLSTTVEPVDHADHVVAWFFGQAFFQKGCTTTVTPVGHADHGVAGVFAQAFF